MKIKAYCVRWKESVMEENGVDEKDIIVRADDMSTGACVDYALFATKKEAVIFREKNKEWEIVPVTITI